MCQCIPPLLAHLVLARAPGRRGCGAVHAYVCKCALRVALHRAVAGGTRAGAGVWRVRAYAQVIQRPPSTVTVLPSFLPAPTPKYWEARGLAGLRLAMTHLRQGKGEIVQVRFPRKYLHVSR